MKKHLSLLIASLLLTAHLYSQTNSILNAAAEVYFGCINAPNKNSITYTLNAVSTVWEGTEHSLYNWTYSLNNNLNTAQYTDDDPNTGNNPNSIIWDGVNLVNTIKDNNQDDYGWGKYRVSCNKSSNVVYIDFRDNHYGKYDPTYVNHVCDLWILYNCTNGIFSYKSAINVGGWKSISNGETLPIWEIKEAGIQNTDEFEPYSPVNLSVNEQNENYPILYWNHKTPRDDCWTGYVIYRLINNSQYDSSGIYIPIDTVGHNDTSYSDTQLEFGHWDYAHYRIKAINNTILSKFSNHA